MQFASTPGIREMEKALRLACMVFWWGSNERQWILSPSLAVAVVVFV